MLCSSVRPPRTTPEVFYIVMQNLASAVFGCDPADTRIMQSKVIRIFPLNEQIFLNISVIFLSRFYVSRIAAGGEVDDPGGRNIRKMAESNSMDLPGMVWAVVSPYVAQLTRKVTQNKASSLV